MIRVVLDTNVIVSAVPKAESLEDRVIKLALHSRLELLASTPILVEYERVLKSDKLSLDPNRVQIALQQIRTTPTIVNPGRALSVSPDPDDNRFLECAEEAGADYLVTGNKRHFPKRWQSTQVVNARELLELIGPELRR